MLFLSVFVGSQSYAASCGTSGGVYTLALSVSAPNVLANWNMARCPDQANWYHAGYLAFWNRSTGGERKNVFFRSKYRSKLISAYTLPEPNGGYFALGFKYRMRAFYLLTPL